MRNCERCGAQLTPPEQARHVCSSHRGNRSDNYGRGTAKPKVVPFRAKRPLPKSARPRGSGQPADYVKWVWAVLIIGSLVWPYLTTSH